MAVLLGGGGTRPSTSNPRTTPSTGDAGQSTRDSASFPGGARARVEGRNLVVDGTAADDRIQVSFDKERNAHDVTVNGHTRSLPGDVDRVIVRSGAGDDHVLARNLEAGLNVGAGAGDDKVILDGANDVFVDGGSGRDWVGGVGRNTRSTNVEDKPADPSTLNPRAASYNLMTQLGGSANALGLVIQARGGDHLAPVSPERQQAATDEIQRRLNLSSSPSAEQLRDMDHYLNSFGAASSVLPNGEGDGFLERTGRTLGRSAAAVGQAAIIAGYSAGKAVAQATGVDVIGMASGGQYPGAGEGVSRPSLHEVRVALQGAFDGTYDPTPDGG